jgi:hypothetical protein
VVAVALQRPAQGTFMRKIPPSPYCFPSRDSLIFEDILQGIGGLLRKRCIFAVLLLVLGCFLGLSVRIRAQNEQKTKKNEEKRRKTKKSDAEFPIYCGFPAVFDKVFDRVKQELREPIIGGALKTRVSHAR